MYKTGSWCQRRVVGVENGQIGVQNGWLVLKMGSSCRKWILLYAVRVIVAMVGTCHCCGGDVVTWW